MISLQDKIALMQYCAGGGKIEMSPKNNNDWHTVTNPTWNWVAYDYRIRQVTPKILYEWWYRDVDNTYYIDTRLKTAAQALDHRSYGKTGRWLNPTTKEFGNTLT